MLCRYRDGLFGKGARIRHPLKRQGIPFYDRFQEIDVQLVFKNHLVDEALRSEQFADLSAAPFFLLHRDNPAAQFGDNIRRVLHTDNPRIQHEMKMGRVFICQVKKTFMETEPVCVAFLDTLNRLFFIPGKLVHQAADAYIVFGDKTDGEKIGHAFQNDKRSAADKHTVAFRSGFQHYRLQIIEIFIAVFCQGCKYTGFPFVVFFHFFSREPQFHYFLFNRFPVDKFVIQPVRQSGGNLIAQSGNLPGNSDNGHCEPPVDFPDHKEPGRSCPIQSRKTGTAEQLLQRSCGVLIHDLPYCVFIRYTQKYAYKDIYESPAAQALYMPLHRIKPFGKYVKRKKHMTEDKNLKWTEKTRKIVCKTPVMTVFEVNSTSPDGDEGNFTVMDAPDWVITIPVLHGGAGSSFVMVRQWRHGAASISIEFPGGVVNPGEEPADGAARELLEETGYRAQKLVRLGSVSPNPALMNNRIHFYAAEDLEDTHTQHLDRDEFVSALILPEREDFEKMGQEPFIHALMCAALEMYRQHYNR